MIENNHAGQGLVEYALIILLVALVVVGTLATLGITLDTFYFSEVAGAFQ